jgi:hypothetical protein
MASMRNIDSSTGRATHDRLNIEIGVIQFFRHNPMPTTFSTSC